MDVVINGVRFVPAIEANRDMRAIARGLIAEFWGCVKDSELEEKIDGLTVRIMDDGQGTPVEVILAHIADALSDA